MSSSHGVLSKPAVNVMSLLRSSLALALFVILISPPFFWFGWTRHGGWGIVTAAVAGGICLISGVIALGVTFRGYQNGGITGILCGTLVRTGVPLVAGLLLANWGGPLAEAGIFGMIMGFYLLTLAAETLLALRLAPRPNRHTAKSPHIG